jgi:DNA-binding MarR family transcriptional regulator
MRIKRGEKTAGVDSVKLRDFLRRFGDRVDQPSIANRFSMSATGAEKLIDDLLELGLIWRSETQYDKAMVNYETTIKGNAFGMANAAKPVSRKYAEGVLREFLARIKTVNGREDLAYRVESVVIFGSYLKGAPHLNDLDLAVELIGKWNDNASYLSACRPSMERARSSGRRFRNVVDEVSWPRTEVLLLLKNRSRTISLCEWDSLTNMPELRYCVLVGDKLRIAKFIKDGRPVELPGAVEADP